MKRLLTASVLPTDPADQADLLTATQAAAHAGVSTTTLHRWLYEGLRTIDGETIVKLVGRRHGGRWLIAPSAISAFMDQINGIQAEASAV